MISEANIRKPGRPTKLTAATRKRLLSLVSSGISSTRAARMLGICPDTITDWCRVNPDFSEELEDARERCLGTLEDRIHRASRSDWRAAGWLLERKLPEEYGRRPEPKIETEISFERLLELARQVNTTHPHSGSEASQHPAPMNS